MAKSDQSKQEGVAHGASNCAFYVAEADQSCLPLCPQVLLLYPAEKVVDGDFLPICFRLHCLNLCMYSSPLN